MTDTTQRGARTRRGFMRQLAGTTLVLGFAPRSGRWVTAAETAPDTPFDKVPPLRGTLHLDEVSLDAAAQDFGRLVRRRPIAVLKPGSVRDISRMLRFAARHGLRVAVRGHGHAIYGQTQVEGGIVIDMSTLASVLVRYGRASVDAGSSWLSVLEATLLRGLTPPVLPDYLGLSTGSSTKTPVQSEGRSIPSAPWSCHTTTGASITDPPGRCSRARNGCTTRGTSWPRVRICSASTRRLRLRADGAIAART
jgi:FAD binding domain